MNYESYLSEQDSAGESQPEPKARKKRGLWDLLSTMKFAIWILVALGRAVGGLDVRRRTAAQATKPRGRAAASAAR